MIFCYVRKRRCPFRDIVHRLIISEAADDNLWSIFYHRDMLNLRTSRILLTKKSVLTSTWQDNCLVPRPILGLTRTLAQLGGQKGTLAGFSPGLPLWWIYNCYTFLVQIRLLFICTQRSPTRCERCKAPLMDAHLFTASSKAPTRPIQYSWTARCCS